MNAVLTLAIKDLKLLVRDKFALFWILAFPLMFALFFGAIFGGGGDDDGRGAITLTVVDEDGSAGSRALVERLASHESVRLVRVGEGDAAPLEALTLDAARSAVQKGRRAAYLRIPAGFGDDPYAIFGGGDAPELEIGIDPQRQAEAGFLQGILTETLFGGVFDRFRDKATVRADLDEVREQVGAADDIPAGQKLVLLTFFGALGVFVEQLDFGGLAGDAPPGGATGAGASEASANASGAGASGAATSLASPSLAVPFTIVDVSRDRSNQPRSTWDITFPQALVWGLMSVALGFAITLVRERTAGTLLRLRMAPVGHAQLMLGKGLGCFLACMLTMIVLLGFGSLALGVRFDSVPLLLVAMTCTSVCFTGLMLTISVLGKTEAAVAGASWGVLMPFAMIGGGMIPLIAMPSWLVSLSVVSPFKWAITAVEGASWRGFGAGDMLLPCAILIGIGAVFSAIGVAISKKLDG